MSNEKVLKKFSRPSHENVAPTDKHRSERRPDVQGLRAVAVILVILFHANLPVPGGFVGVDVFFVISGFVITRLLWKELQLSNRINLRRFYTRRVRRLLPALALVQLFVAAGALVLQSPLGLQQQTARTGIAASLFAANAELASSVDYFAAPAEYHPLLHTWTLAVEEQFYFFFPALLFVAWQFGRRTKSARSPKLLLSFAVMSVLLVSLAASVFLLDARGAPFGALDSNRIFAFYASPVRAWEFAAGSLLALYEPALSRLSARIAAVCGAIGLALIVAAAFAFTDATPFPGYAALLPVLGTTLLILAGTGRQVGISRLLSRPLPQWIGEVSYGWYLWHWPFIVFTRAIWPHPSPWLLLLAALAALIPTWLSYRYVENPIRNNSRIVGWRAVGLAGICTLVPVALFAALYASTLFPSRTMRELNVANRLHLADARECKYYLPTAAGTREGCTWKSDSPRGTIILIGDSNAGQVAEPIAAVADKLRLNFTPAIFWGCPFADVITRKAGPFDEDGCRNFVTRWTADLVESRPSLVIIGNMAVEYIRPGSHVSFEHPATGEIASQSDKARAWEEGLRSTIGRLNDAGVPVLLIHNVPHFHGSKSFDLRACPAFRIYSDLASCGVTITKQESLEYNRPARQAEERALRGMPRARGADFTDVLCAREYCSTYRDGQFLYRDGWHLNVGGAMRLAPEFEKHIRSMARIDRE
ncbi:acyltransferase family protein [Sphingomonas sp.]|uniref:acyltransferase family protein n=1 Tax=Sphingomonas sp. TaxID=28214 RepID=UPI00286DFB3B|nr:acyltransferase family protein [Sphingomonas sp.]